MNFLQTIFDYAVTADRTQMAGRLGSSLARRMLRRAGSAAVLYEVDGVEIEFPATHSTPHVWAIEPGNSKSLGRVARVVAQKYPSDLVIDIGANVGDSAAIIRSAGVNNPILAIEGCEPFFRVLSENAKRLQGITPVHTFIAAETHTASVNMKVLDTGNAVVLESDIEGVEWQSATAQFKTLSSTVMDHAANSEICLIKTDIEGYDMPVLGGSLGLLGKFRPVLFLELHVSDDDERRRGIGWREFFDDLRKIGYHSAFYWHNSGDLSSLVRLGDESSLEATNEYYRNRRGLMYADVCIVHEKDIELIDRILQAEAQSPRSRD